MKKIKIVLVFVIAIGGNMSLSKVGNTSNYLNISLLKKAMAQSEVEVTDGITGEDQGDGWYSGYSMEDQQYCTGSSTTVSGTVGTNPSGTGSITYTYETISCCESANTNTACNTSNQDSRC
jgi:hypothetical protein